MESFQGYDEDGVGAGWPSGRTFEETVQGLRAALRHSPKHVGVMLALGKTYYLHGKIALAVEVLQRAVEVDPTNPIPFYRLGICHFRAARLEQASQSLTKATELQPNFVMAHYWLGLSAYHQGKYEKAQECFETICRESPEFLIAHYHAALSGMALGRWEAVRDHLESLSAQGSASTRVALYLARAYRRLGRPTDAIKLLRSALALTPHDKMLSEALSELTDVQDP